MLLTDWLGRIKSSFRKNTSRKSTRRQLRKPIVAAECEILENRTLLSGVTGSLYDGKFQIRGTDAADSVETDFPDDYLRVIEKVNGTWQTNTELTGKYHRSQVQEIEFLGYGGDDYFRNYSNVAVTAFGYAGNDTLIGGGGNDRLYGMEGEDRLFGLEGNDYLHGGDGADALYGNQGIDYIFGGTGNDYIDGGEGNDSLYGVAGNDYIIGGAGADYIRGGDGEDSLYGGVGNDYILGDEGNDYIRGGVGVDSLYGDGGNDYILGDEGNDYIRGGVGVDSLYGDGGNDYILGDEGNDYIRGGEGNDSLYGGVGNDYILGDADNDYILGGDGDDSLYGEAGADNIIGENGDDYIRGGEGDDALYGVDGNDYILGDEGNDTIYGGAGNDVLHGLEGDDVLFGEAGNDAIYGGSQHDLLLGGVGDDALYGGEGDDDLRGELGSDQLLGEAGNDLLTEWDTDESRNWLYGGTGNDRLESGDGIDYLSGGVGDDYLRGNFSDDHLEGGIGEDHFHVAFNIEDFLNNPNFQLFVDLNDTIQVTVDIGTLYDKYIIPVVRQVQDITRPIEKTINFLERDIPVITAVTGAVFGDVIRSQVDIDLGYIEHILHLINTFDTRPAPFGKIDLGTFQLGDTFDEITSVDAVDHLGRLFDWGISLDGLGLDFAVVNDTTTFVRLMLGQHIDLFQFDLPEIHADARVGWDIPVAGFFNVSIGGSISVDIDGTVGMNSRGLSTGNLLDGLFVENVQLLTELKVYADAGVGFDAVLAEAHAGVYGGITGVVSAQQIERVYITDDVDLGSVVAVQGTVYAEIGGFVEWRFLVFGGREEFVLFREHLLSF